MARLVNDVVVAVPAIATRITGIGRGTPGGKGHDGLEVAITVRPVAVIARTGMAAGGEGGIRLAVSDVVRLGGNGLRARVAVAVGTAVGDRVRGAVARDVGVAVRVGVDLPFGKQC